MSVFHIRESRYYGLKFFLLRKYMRILSEHWKLSVLGGSTVPYFALLSAVFKALFAMVCKPQKTRQGESSVHANVQA